MLPENDLSLTNFRDVGEFVNLIADKELMREKSLFRGGKIQTLESLSEIENPRTVINLRSIPDPEDRFTNVQFLHFPIANTVEKYDTALPEVRTWLNDILSALSDPGLLFPVYIHCASGKDRTGIVIASLLWLLGIPEAVITDEYLLSEGGISRSAIELSLQGLKTRKNYFHRVSREQLKIHFLI